MTEQAWQIVAVPASEAAAQILLGLLQSESIPARLKANVPVPGLPVSFQVEVPENVVRQAQDLLRHNQVTDEELVQLAMSAKHVDED